jgi:hypothetical protein
MNTITKAQPGEVLYFTPENMPVLVVMAGDDGIRYIEPMNLEFDNNGSIITKYATYATLSEWTVSFGTLANISATLMGKQS